MRTLKSNAASWVRRSKGFIELNFARRTAVFGLLFHFCAFSAHASDFTEFADESSRLIKEQIPWVRATEKDCSNPSSWEQNLVLPQIEEMMARPLTIPSRLSRWNKSVMTSSSSAELLRFAAEQIPEKAGSTQEKNIPDDAPKLVWESELPAAVKNSVEMIYHAMQSAMPMLKQSHAKLSDEERAAIMALNDLSPGMEFGEPVHSSFFKRKYFGSMNKFDTKMVIQAGAVLAESAETEISRLADWVQDSSNKSAASFVRAQAKTPMGNIIVSGTGDDYYSAEVLKGAALVIDLGGRNHYEGPVAGAGLDEIKVAADFGADVVISATGTLVSAGGGIFGIGLLFLPNPDGVKEIVSESYSQGGALCGVGGLFLNGPAKLRGEKYTQGTAIFGAGILSNESGTESVYMSRRYSQGVGFTQGVGIFRHKGNGAKMMAGLVDPDPREPLGTTSLCQGVGYGPRAFAGGGIGICVLRGNGMTVESSYFAQGAGYWLAAGSFALEGDSCTVKARRYDQGSGIHNAFGGFFAEGNSNHIINWGVGPAFGWDRGIGWSLIRGNLNRVQADWGASSASTNSSRSFFRISGKKNVLVLPGAGSAQITRDVPDYAVCFIDGEENSLNLPKIKSARKLNGTLFASMWGVLHVSDVMMGADITLPKQEWSSLPREMFARDDTVSLSQEIAKAESLDKKQKIERLIHVASAFSLDKLQPRNALSRLVQMKEDEIPVLVKSFDPGSVEEFLQVRTALAILGPRATPALLDEIKNEQGFRRAALMSMLLFSRTKDVTPLVLAELDNPDWRLRGTAVRILGQLFNIDSGNTPGRMYALMKMEEWLTDLFAGKNQDTEMNRILARRTYAESVNMASVAADWSESDRLKLLSFAPEDISGNADEKQASQILAMVRNEKKSAVEKLKQEIADSKVLAETAKARIRDLLTKASALPMENTRKEFVQAAVIALGNMGSTQDAGLIARFINHPDALVREGTALSLGRLGRPAMKYLSQIAQSSDADQRMLTFVSAGENADGTLASLVEKGLADKEVRVRMSALIAIDRLPSEKAKKHLRSIAGKKRAEQSAPGEDIQRYYLFGE